MQYQGQGLFAVWSFDKQNRSPQGQHCRGQCSDAPRYRLCEGFRSSKEYSRLIPNFAQIVRALMPLLLHVFLRPAGMLLVKPLAKICAIVQLLVPLLLVQSTILSLRDIAVAEVRVGVECLWQMEKLIWPSAQIKVTCAHLFLVRTGTS